MQINFRSFDYLGHGQILAMIEALSRTPASSHEELEEHRLLVERLESVRDDPGKALIIATKSNQPVAKTYDVSRLFSDETIRVVIETLDHIAIARMIDGENDHIIRRAVMILTEAMDNGEKIGVYRPGSHREPDSELFLVFTKAQTTELVYVSYNLNDAVKWTLENSHMLTVDAFEFEICAVRRIGEVAINTESLPVLARVDECQNVTLTKEGQKAFGAWSV